MADQYDINLKDSDSLESSYSSAKSNSTEIINDLKKNVEYLQSCLSDDIWQGKTKNALNEKLQDFIKANETVEAKFKEFDNFIGSTVVVYKDTDSYIQNQSDNLSDGN